VRLEDLSFTCFVPLFDSESAEVKVVGGCRWHCDVTGELEYCNPLMKVKLYYQSRTMDADVGVRFTLQNPSETRRNRPRTARNDYA
jgi:hypothetical protein